MDRNSRIGKRENRSLGYGGEIIRVTTKNIHEKLGVDTLDSGSMYQI